MRKAEDTREEKKGEWRRKVRKGKGTKVRGREGNDREGKGRIGNRRGEREREGEANK